MQRLRLVVAGNGMVGHKVVETMLERGALAEWDIEVFGEEPRVAYDRVGLSTYFSGVTPDELSLVAPGAYDDIVVHLDDRIVSIDRAARTVTSQRGITSHYDALVLATGSYPFVPPVPGNDLPGCFVYRTIEDLQAIETYAAGRRVGAVVGGGLLGLEAANALHALGLETHVVEFAERLMPLQVDAGGGSALRRRIEELGVTVHTGLANYLPIFFVDRFGLTKVTAASFAALCAAAGSLLRPLGGKLADTFDGTRVLRMVLIGVAGIAALLATLPPLAITVALLFVALGTFGIGNGAVFQVIPQRYGHRMAPITGLVGAAGGIGGFLLPFGLGRLVGTTGSFAAGFVAIAVITGVAGIAIGPRLAAWRAAVVATAATNTAEAAA
jgi:hypothetical protein